MRDDRARADHAGRRRLDDLGVLEDRLELADAALHVALLVLGGVVVAVLGQVAQLAGALDLRGDLEAAPRRGEVVELGPQPVVRGLGQLVRFHGPIEPIGGGRRVPGTQAVRTLSLALGRSHRACRCTS